MGVFFLTGRPIRLLHRHSTQIVPPITYQVFVGVFLQHSLSYIDSYPDVCHYFVLRL